MSKRILSSSAGKECDAKKVKRHWSLGLVESMRDPKEIYKESKNIVVIRDKYPKAKVHYLMLPRDDIRNIYQLNKNHLNLLEEFGMLLKEIEENHKDVALRSGFHAIPSMQRMHMHIISVDMISPFLKTKVHWNSFTTSFFIPYKDIIRDLKENGCIAKISSDLHKTLMAIPLKCNQCDFAPKNMPQLKEHLIKHVN